MFSTSEDQMAMPLYVSHKTVHALEIANCVKVDEGRRVVMFKDAGYGAVTLEAKIFARYVPVPGDFYVVYADGYKSFSPRKAFLDGYTRDDPNALELGAAVRRSGLAGA